MAADLSTASPTPGLEVKPVPGDAPIFDVRGLVKHYPIGGGLRLQRSAGFIQAVDGVDFAIRKGETLGLVGESGCGKTTVARTLMRLEEPSAGAALFHGEDIFRADAAELKIIRRRIQMIFQDPYASLNPRMRVGQIIAEPWVIHADVLPRRLWATRIGELLESVGLLPDHARRYPHEFSGGQRQRIGIARALALDPEILVCDEPVSALDVSVQAQVVNLLEKIQSSFHIACLFIAHDLAVVRHMSHRIAVMYLGRIVEIGPVESVYKTPRHPYTKALLSAQPRIDFANEAGGDRILLQGEVPSPANPPSGCRFRTRCWKAQSLCAERSPPLLAHRPDQQVACHFPLEPTDTMGSADRKKSTQ
ncbi:MAG TPA: oligopeptide/dipeptide ABC transporter ATP-binding protein [Burkholderiales bacterium]|nr:oligopeptide/dipeptide ABC transporter ATP-binding protein [Burkholderiales bacterium]